LKPLKAYTFFANLASSLTSPFISFFVASNGIIGSVLAIATSAGTTFPGIAQYFLINLSIKAKKLLFWGTLAEGIIWLLIGLLALTNTFFVVLYVIITLIMGVTNFGWLLILDKISGTSRGLVLSQYNLYVYLAGLLATLFTGFVASSDINVLRFFFIASGLLYIYGAYVNSKIDIDVEFKSKSVSPMKVFKNSKLRNFLLANSLFTFTWAMAWPLFPLAQVYKFHLDSFEIAIINVIGNLSTVILQRIVGRLIDKHRVATMFFSRFALATFPLAYAFSTTPYEIYASSLVSGFTNSASVSLTAYILDVSDYQHKRTIIALYNMLAGLAALGGSLFSSFIFGLLLSYFSNMVTTIDVMLGSIGGLRIIASLLFLRVEEKIDKL